MTTPQPRADVCWKLGLCGESGEAVTLGQYKEAVRVKIAALHPDIIRYHNDQWEYFDGLGWWRCRRYDPTEDLNACHEWEEKMTNEEKREHGSLLMEMCHDECRKFGAIYATALQRCEARILSAESDKPLRYGKHALQLISDVKAAIFNHES